MREIILLTCPHHPQLFKPLKCAEPVDWQTYITRFHNYLKVKRKISHEFWFILY